MKRQLHSSDLRDNHFARNIFGISAVEFFWGLGLPVLVESTFLQLFLKSLGASDKVIGLVPALFSVGMALFALISAYFTAHLVHKKKAVVITHAIGGFPLLLFGVILLFGGYSQSTVSLFLCIYFLFSITIGIISPLWLSFIIKIFSKRRMVSGFSAMMVFQLLGRLLGSLVIVKLVATFAFSMRAAGVIFLCIGSLFFLSAFFFLIVEEVVDKTDTGREAHSVATLAAAFYAIITHKNYMFFILSSLEPFACVTALSFYANYATHFHGISSAYAAGLFVACVYLGSITTSVVFGWFDILTLKKKFIVSRIFCFCGTVFIAFAHTLPEFLAISALLGASRGISLFGYSPAVKRLSGKEDATDYFAATPIITLPMSFGMPFLCGIFLYHFVDFGAISYRIMFLALGLLILLSLLFIALTDFGKE